MLRDIPALIGWAMAALYVRERRARVRLERLGAATLETLLDAIDANNPLTGAHVRRVAEYALILALIAIIAIVSLIFMGNQVSDKLSVIGSAIDGVTP